MEFVAISAGAYHACAIEKGSGKLYCWGQDDEGQVSGFNKNYNKKQVAKVPKVPKGDIKINNTCNAEAKKCFQSTVPKNLTDASFISVSAGDDYTYGIYNDTENGNPRRLVCWGNDAYDLPGKGHGGFGQVSGARGLTIQKGKRKGKTERFDKKQFASVAAGWGHTCAVDVAGTFFCWGQSEPTKEVKGRIDLNCNSFTSDDPKSGCKSRRGGCKSSTQKRDECKKKPYKLETMKIWSGSPRENKPFKDLPRFRRHQYGHYQQLHKPGQYDLMYTDPTGKFAGKFAERPKTKIFFEGKKLPPPPPGCKESADQNECPEEFYKKDSEQGPFFPMKFSQQASAISSGRTHTCVVVEAMAAPIKCGDNCKEERRLSSSLGLMKGKKKGKKNKKTNKNKDQDKKEKASKDKKNRDKASKDKKNSEKASKEKEKKVLAHRKRNWPVWNKDKAGALFCFISETDGKPPDPAPKKCAATTKACTKDDCPNYCQISPGLKNSCDDQTRKKKSGPVPKLVRSISAGFAHTCVIEEGTNKLFCWGWDSYGQVSGFEKLALADEEFSSVSAGGFHTCAVLKKTSELKCWGKDDNKQSSGVKNIKFKTHYSCNTEHDVLEGPSSCTSCNNKKSTTGKYIGANPHFTLVDPKTNTGTCTNIACPMCKPGSCCGKHHKHYVLNTKSLEGVCVRHNDDCTAVCVPLGYNGYGKRRVCSKGCNQLLKVDKANVTAGASLESELFDMVVCQADKRVVCDPVLNGTVPTGGFHCHGGGPNSPMTKLKAVAWCPFSPQLWNLGGTCIANHVHGDAHPQCAGKCGMAAPEDLAGKINSRCRRATPNDNKYCLRMGMTF